MRARQLLSIAAYIGALFIFHLLCSRQYDGLVMQTDRSWPSNRRLQARSEARQQGEPQQVEMPSIHRAVSTGTRLDGVPHTDQASKAGESSRDASAADGAEPARVVPAAAESKSASEAVAVASCPPTRRPYHTLLTAQATTYQAWQSRIMYFHWKKQGAAEGACTEMAGFTRLVASTEGKADGLEREIPSFFVPCLTPAALASFGHFGVMNRPWSVVQFINLGGLERVKESYVYIAETDHVLMRALPNLASETAPAAYRFGYMTSQPRVQSIIDRHAPGTNWRDVQPIGPSPVIISKEHLAAITPLWYNISASLKRDPEADKRFGWVLEMWGYSIAAASLHIVHRVATEFQLEGGAGIPAPENRYIFHYTFGLEYMLDGRQSGIGTIGEWSLDKRHYGASYPPRRLRPPPDRASAGTHFLLNAFNEASAGIEDWPDSKAFGTVGWRRNWGEGIQGSELAARIKGTKWKWAGIPGLEFEPNGALKTPWGAGGWGILPGGLDLNDGGFCELGCAFADFGAALHNLQFGGEMDSFKAMRVGDGVIVEGTKAESV